MSRKRLLGKDFSVKFSVKKIWYKYVYDVSVDYDTIAIDDILLNIHKHLMKKYDIWMK